MENKLTINKMKLIPIILFIWLFGAVQLINAQETTWVLDETNDLTEETLTLVTHLNEQVLADYDIEPQLGIEILNKLPEEYADIDEYRNERFKELGVGNKEHDSGILLVIALEERVMGIETGYGAEAIVRDIEASQIISGDMKNYLGQYLEESNPEYLNSAIVQATNEIGTLLEKGNTGVLFEEREEEQQRIEEERQAKVLAKQEFIDSMVTGANYLLVAFASLLGLAGIRSWANKKKLKELEKKITTSFMDYYDNNLPAPIKKEMSKEDYKEIFVDNFEYYLDNYAPKKEFDEMWESRVHITTDIRVIHYKNTIEKRNNTLDQRVYLNASDKYKAHINNSPDYTIEKHIRNVEKDYQSKKDQVVAYNNKLIPIIESEMAEYRQAEVGYNPWVFDTKATHRQLIQNHHLNDEGVITGNARLVDSQAIKSDIQQYMYQNIVEDVMMNEFNDVSFGYGNSQAFRALVIGGVLGSMTYLSRDKLIRHMTNLLATYRQKEEEIEMERIRIAKKRRREEEDRRRRQAAMSHSSSSSSGGSFGGGFGGGSSGGGGASGGF